ncbi:DUF4832 domain-containing protein [Paenibacillus hamazuiensis]|uniref:DUF4832 domain-containing protein n=1 Tax=Paenibacillus hamazuiensis TaxID=2936508 RepID=UPI00200EA27E|nr:DUF4832 domain-containing protein [Paenibacillus hamazuiensis]
MLRKSALSLLLIVALLYVIVPFGSASAATLSYTGDFATAFPNPERGYHNRYEIIDDPGVNDYASSATSIAGFNPDMLDRTFARAKADGDTLIHSYIHLDKYKNTDPLPQALLDNLASGLAAIRAAGLKIVLRPAYAWSDSPSVPESRILGHIQQLDAVIAANADVVNHLEAGYLGPWGEWHTSQYTDPFNRTEADTRYRIIQKILSTTPASIPVVIRYPIFIKEVTELPAPSGSTALTQQDKDRIGFHNDCFLSDSADMGTYDNNSWMGWYYVEEKKQWMYDMATASGANKMVGGETCDSAGSNDAAGVNVQREMSKLHFTEINEDYAPVNLNIWKAANLDASGNDPAETAFTRIKRKLGYRLRMVDATFPTSASPGAGFTFSAHLSNDGYAGIIKPRPAFLVFDNGTQRYDVPLSGLDPRQWVSGTVNVPPQTVALPANMTAGTYKLAFWLPDNAPGLRSRPEYSVRLANTGMWDAAKGYNVLSNAVTVGTPTIPAAPTNLTATAGNGQTTLSWKESSGAASYSVFRSTTSGSGYAQIAGNIAGTSYVDTGLNNGTTYYYVVTAVNSAGSSSSSNQASATPNNNVTVPSAPTGLTATAGNAQVALTWKASAGATSYTVLRSTTNGSGYSAIADNVGDTAYSDAGVTNGTTYYYVVQAVNSAGSSGISAQASATPSAPATAVTIDSFPSQANFAAKINDLNQTISWSMDSIYYGSDTSGNLVMNSSSAGQYLQENVNQSLAGLQNLIIRARDWGETDTEQHWNVVLNDGTDHTVGPLSAYGNINGSYVDLSIPLASFGANLANTKYIRIVHKDATYAVLLIDAIKTDGPAGGGGGGDTQAPTAPSNVNGAASSTWIHLSWTASTDNRGVTGYDVYRGGSLIGSSTSNGFLDTGLAPNTAYTYTVKAKDAAGNVSPASAPATITTLAPDTTGDLPTVPGGLPVNPYPSQTPDSSLTVHALAKGTDPVTNPLKGFAIWFYPGDRADKTTMQYGGINNSVEWRYFGLGELMTGMNTFEWEPMEAALDEVASHGKQLALRVASCQSFSSKDYPDFLSGQIRNGCILNYDSPTVKQAFQNFIAAFGAKYDGDPRIAFITMGLVGYWGEWHTWPNDGSNGTENWMISDAGANVLMDAYNAAFRKTPVENRYPRSGGGTHLTSLSRIGYHDDSFAYKENDPNLGKVGSMTLPLSMGGKTDAQLTQALLYGAENKWVTGSFGGEVRPEVQGNLFDPASATKDDALADIEMTHDTWMICQNCKYNKNDPNEVAAWQKMGYNFYASNAYFNNTVSGSFKVGVQIVNTGVAPFYYDPDMYPVELALKDGSGSIVKTWTTNWDLRKIMPLQIRAFPDWNVPGNPTYVNFGTPQYFDATVSAAGVTPGSYQLAMHIYNPLWKIKEADVRAKGHMPSYLPWNNPLPILFANQSQGADGWLGLGTIAIQ